MKSKPSLRSLEKNELQVPFACKSSSASSPAHSCASCASSESPTCWICMDDESTEVLLVNACGCKSRHVHGSCLASWVHRSQQHACKVCTQPWSPVFRPSEIISVVNFEPAEASLSFDRRRRNHDMSCYSTTLMLTFGFIYGTVYAHFCSSVERQMMTAVSANLCVIFVWNRLCASPLRRENPHSAFEDLCLLCGTYTFFLTGWIVSYFIILPNIQLFLYSGVVAHAWNFLTFCFLSSMRCFCVSRDNAADINGAG